MSRPYYTTYLVLHAWWTLAGSAGSYATTVIAYTYDRLNRLTKAEYSDGDVYEYQYDEVGNPVSAAPQVQSEAARRFAGRTAARR